MRRRVPTREELSRTLVLYGAFTASGWVMDGDDQKAIEHLQRLRARIDDDRGEAIDRVIRGLMEISKPPRRLPAL
jgi:hypothetical protein